jgi:hypothetical protein
MDRRHELRRGQKAAELLRSLRRPLQPRPHEQPATCGSATCRIRGGNRPSGCPSPRLGPCTDLRVRRTALRLRVSWITVRLGHCRIIARRKLVAHAFDAVLVTKPAYSYAWNQLRRAAKETDAPICRLCGQDINLTLRWPDPNVPVTRPPRPGVHRRQRGPTTRISPPVVLANDFRQAVDDYLRAEATRKGEFHQDYTVDRIGGVAVAKPSTHPKTSTVTIVVSSSSLDFDEPFVSMVSNFLITHELVHSLQGRIRAASGAFEGAIFPSRTPMN